MCRWKSKLSCTSTAQECGRALEYTRPENSRLVRTCSHRRRCRCTHRRRCRALLLQSKVAINKNLNEIKQFKI